MKKISNFATIVLCVITLSSSLPVNARAQQNILTRGIVKKTAVVIAAAHKSVKENKNYTGDLANAYAHQRLAAQYYRNSQFIKAARQSKRARYLAIKALKANKGVVENDWAYTDEEKELLQNSPNDTALDMELKKEIPAAFKKDIEVIKSTPDVDVQ
jgi:hypothetical protein